jgi:obg-like ATPase 1
MHTHRAADVDAAEAAALKDVRKTPDMKLPLRFYEVMKRVRELLTANKPVRDGEWTGPEVETIREKLPSLITTKPVIYMVNLSAADFARKKSKHLAGIAEWVAAHGGGPVIPFSVEWEQKLWDLRDDAAGKAAFLEATGSKSALPRAIVTR